MRLIDADVIKIKPMYMHDICGVVMIRVEDIARILNDMPTISPEPERKTWKWEKENQYIDEWGDTIEILRCPICEFKHDYTQGNTSHSDDGWFNFCPNCGVKMEGESDD